MVHRSQDRAPRGGSRQTPRRRQLEVRGMGIASAPDGEIAGVAGGEQLAVRRPARWRSNETPPRLATLRSSPLLTLLVEVRGRSAQSSK